MCNFCLMLGEVLGCKLPSESTIHIELTEQVLASQTVSVVNKTQSKTHSGLCLHGWRVPSEWLSEKEWKKFAPFQGTIWDLKASLDVSGHFSGVKFLSKGKCLVIFPCSYRKAAQHISALHLDRPMHALNRTVYWLEYILRHDGAPYLRPAVYDLSLYEYFCLDILALLLLCLAGIGFVLYKSVVWCRRKGASPVYQNGNCMKGHFTDEKKLK